MTGVPLIVRRPPNTFFNFNKYTKDNPEEPIKMDKDIPDFNSESRKASNEKEKTEPIDIVT